jgi:hypothetical protein
MSNQKSVNQQQNAVTTASDAPVPITPEAMVDQLRTLREQIPEYVQLPVPQMRSLQSVANIHPEFAQAAINAIGASPRVEGVVGQTSEELQGDAEAAARWSKVEDELAGMLKGVALANLTRRNRVGKAALLAYVVSKRLVSSPEHADLLPHLAEMRRTIRLGRPRKSKQQPQPQAPAPSPSPSPEPNPTPVPHV